MTDQAGGDYFRPERREVEPVVPDDVERIIDVEFIYGPVENAESTVRCLIQQAEKGKTFQWLTLTQ